MARHGSKVWLVNTGWTGGPYGIGRRISLKHTRAMVRAAFSGALNNVSYSTDPVFGLSVPQTCPEVPSEVLNPRTTWADASAYDMAAAALNAKFHENFRKFD